MYPSRDHTCQRYIDDPERHWYGGRWRTAEQIEAARERERKYYSKYRAENLEAVRAADREYVRRKLGWYADDPGLMQFVKEVVES